MLFFIEKEMDLGLFLKGEIAERINELDKALKIDKKSLKLLEKINLDDASYNVSISSRWANEGESSVKDMKYQGTLKDAIKEAEKEFQKINNRGDIQGDYFVSIKLGEGEYPLPAKFWGKFKKR